MPRPPAPLPVELAEHFRPADARSVGVGAGRLRARDLAHPFRGVCARVRDGATDGAADDDDSPLALDRARRAAETRRAHAASLVLPRHAFLTGRTAAIVAYGVPIEPGHDLDVAVFAPHRAPRRAGVHAVQVRPKLANVLLVDGLPVASPATAWAMLAPESSVRELVAVGDALVRIPRDDRGRRRSDRQLATIEQLRNAAEAGRRPGRGRLLAALRLIRIGSMSPLETEWRLDAIAGGLPEPELDLEVRDAHGRLLGIADAAFPLFQTLVEIEGDHHRTDRAQWNRDIEKMAAYVAAGWEPVRLTSTHIRGPQPSAIPMVRSVLLRRGWTP